MKYEPQSVLDLLGARTTRLRLLAADLIESRQALVRLDLDAIYLHNARQEEICQEIRNLDGQLRSSAGQPAASAGVLSVEKAALACDSEGRGRLRAQLEEHEQIRLQVQELSRIQADLLRRSRRYLRILCNLVSNSMGLYEAPKPGRAAPVAAQGL